MGHLVGDRMYAANVRKGTGARIYGTCIRRRLSRPDWPARFAAAENAETMTFLEALLAQESRADAEHLLGDMGLL